MRKAGGPGGDYVLVQACEENNIRPANGGGVGHDDLGCWVPHVSGLHVGLRFGLDFP